MSRPDTIASRPPALRLTWVGALLAIAAWALAFAGQASAAAPAWRLSQTTIGTEYFNPGTEGDPLSGPGFLITVTNIGDAPTSGDYTIVDTLPDGLTPVAGAISGKDGLGNALSCEVSDQTVTCTGSEPVAQNGNVEVRIPVSVDLDVSGGFENTAVVEGGGAAVPASASANAVVPTGPPAWKVSMISAPTNFVPGDHDIFGGLPQYAFFAANIGGSPTTGPITFTDTLPAGLTPDNAYTSGAESSSAGSCNIAGQSVTCTIPGPVPPGRAVRLHVNVEVDAALPDPSTLTNEATISGGGAPTVSASTTTTISSTLPAFDFISGPAGFGTALTGPDGAPATQAGDRVSLLTIDVGFPSVLGVLDFMGGAEAGIRDLHVDLPPGVIVDPSATPIRCTEAQLEGGDCPDASAAGKITVVTSVAGVEFASSPVYNMIPPPGSGASFGFNAAGIGLYIHILGSVRAGDYAITAVTPDILALTTTPILGGLLRFWGDPSAAIHNAERGECVFQGGTCSKSVTPQSIPMLSMPTSCGPSLPIEGRADSWLNPGVFKSASALVADADGNPTGVTGCNALDFQPSLEARPTTTVADAPSGLSVNLHIPQSRDLGTLATAHLRKAVVTLPEGLVINPSGANGLGSCSSAEVGIDPQTAVPDGDPVTCPNASRVGSVQVDTSLLDHPLRGSVFVATPYDNPFNSLLALYLVVEDPQSGTLVKLPGQVIPDPKTGQLTSVFDKGPQLPFGDFKIELFGGPAAPLRTPPACGNYTTTSQMTPWSAPDSGPPATPKDTYAINKAPTGTCPSSPETQPNTPSFDAGSASLIAGSYTPFVLNLRRNDGTQQFSSVTVTPPPGLLGKLAGTQSCPQSALEAAAAKSGRDERANPSCPAASQIGSVDVGAGAGPAPYYTQGKAYLTPPYKGAPLGMAIITPAAAGPYDLGTVVVRTALHLDPESAKITAVSDPIPAILQGIPLDVRSAQIKLDRPEFTLNPTSCDPMSVSGELTSVFGQVASLENRFQVAECGRLGFKPSLSLRLFGGTHRGQHPRLRATLTTRPGDANIARASVTLPRSEFLEQAHIGTVCTRVQFAANQCPPASVYGHATALTPLLDYPVTGPVYLRSSNNKLPDLVVALKGPEHQPIEVVVAGRVDSVKGAIRNSFEVVPDAPVSKFVLEMQGGKKSLLINSRNLCKSVNRAIVQLDGQNGKTHDFRPILRNGCKQQGQRKAKRGGGR